jgi:4-hydroxythreonine-4-phosphate dehydrogenase
MYHDQCQIATKLLGFDEGVTYFGGFPFPITTPAHGTAYDIAGSGEASETPMVNALNLMCRAALTAKGIAV